MPCTVCSYEEYKLQKDNEKAARDAKERKLKEQYDADIEKNRRASSIGGVNIRTLLKSTKIAKPKNKKIAKPIKNNLNNKKRGGVYTDEEKEILKQEVLKEIEQQKKENTLTNRFKRTIGVKCCPNDNHIERYKKERNSPSSMPTSLPSRLQPFSPPLIQNKEFKILHPLDENKEDILYDNVVKYGDDGPKIFKSEGQTDEEAVNYLNQNITHTKGQDWTKLGRDKDGHVAWEHWDKNTRGSPTREQIYEPFQNYYDKLKKGNITEHERANLARMNAHLFGDGKTPRHFVHPTGQHFVHHMSQPYVGHPMGQPYVGQPMGIGGYTQSNNLFNFKKFFKPTKTTKAVKPTKTTKTTKTTKASKPTKGVKPKKPTKAAKPTKGVKPKKPKVIKIRKPPKTLRTKKAAPRKLKV